MTTLSVGDIPISVEDTYLTDWVEVDDEVDALLILARFLFGASDEGATAKLYVQTMLPDEVTPMDIACFAFTTENAVGTVNLSRRTPQDSPLTPTDGSLTDDTAIDGVIGPKIRSKVVTSGDYTGSTIVEVRAQVTR